MSTNLSETTFLQALCMIFQNIRLQRAKTSPDLLKCLKRCLKVFPKKCFRWHWLTLFQILLAHFCWQGEEFLLVILLIPCWQRGEGVSDPLLTHWQTFDASPRISKQHSANLYSKHSHISRSSSSFSKRVSLFLNTFLNEIYRLFCCDIFTAAAASWKSTCHPGWWHLTARFTKH